MSDAELTTAYERALRFLRNMVSEPDCYDIAQDSVVTFLGTDRATIANPTAFFWGIVRDKVWQSYEARSRQLRLVGVHDMLSVEDMMTRMSTTVARRDDLERALQTLPLRHQQAFELRYMEALSLEECAEAMRCSLTTIERDIEAARFGLSKALGEALDCDEDVRTMVQRFLVRHG